eukprot:gene11613-13715_t
MSGIECEEIVSETVALNSCSWGDSLLELWEEGQLCDITLCTSTDELPAHRIVLASASPFFRAMFTGAGEHMAEGKSTRVDITGVDGETLRQLVACVYRREVEITPQNVEGLLGGSAYLGLRQIQDACSDFLHASLGVCNCLAIMTMASTYRCGPLHSAARRFSAQHFAEVVEADDGATFLSLLPEDVVLLLRDNELQVQTEQEVLRALLKWVHHDHSARQPLLPGMLSCVRLPLIPTQ